MKGKSKYFKTNFKKALATPGVPDDEIPEFTKEMMDQATLMYGDIVLRGPKKRGRPAGSGRKEPIHIMLDKDILAYFRKSGPGWQTRINAALRKSLLARVAKKAAGARR